MSVIAHGFPALLDRIDLHVEVPAVPWDDLSASAPAPDSGQDSASMRRRVLAARDIQEKRYAPFPACRVNADLSGGLLEEFCALDAAGRSFMEQVVHSLALSARAYTRILRLARTVADLAAEERLTVGHLAEAVNCRTLDRERL